MPNIIAPEHGFIFLHVPKTGGTSIMQALNEYNTTKQYPYNRYATRVRGFAIGRGHGRYKDMLNIFGEDLLGQLKVFAFVRNTWDRMVSLALYQKKKNIHSLALDAPDPREAFKQWLVGRAKVFEKDDDDRRLHGQLEYIEDYDGNIGPKLYRYEPNLWFGVMQACQWLGVECPQEQWFEVSRGRRAAVHYYTRYTIDLVRELFKREIDLLGYSDKEPVI